MTIACESFDGAGLGRSANLLTFAQAREERLKRCRRTHVIAVWRLTPAASAAFAPVQ